MKSLLVVLLTTSLAGCSALPLISSLASSSPKTSVRLDKGVQVAKRIHENKSLLNSTKTTHTIAHNAYIDNGADSSALFSIIMFFSLLLFRPLRVLLSTATNKLKNKIKGG